MAEQPKPMKDDKAYRELVKKIADLVWKKWKEDARRESERLGKRR